MKAEILNSAVEKFYNSASRRFDKGQTTVLPARATAAAIHDDIVKQQTARFDLQAQERHMKYERPSFIVTGEGTKTAQDKYREGWERTFGKKDK